MEPQLSQVTRVPQLDITNSILYTLATLAVGLRFYTRSKIIGKVIAGDWRMLGAWVIATGQFASGVIVCWIIQVVYPLDLGVIKVSVLFLYHELFPSDNFCTVLFCIMGFIGAMTTACVFAFMFQCTPVQSYWIPSTWATERHCVNGGALSTAASSLSTVTDVIILVLPFKYLIALRIFMREKIQVILLMSLGGLTCIASVMRFKAIRIVYQSKDASWDGYDLSFWSAFEYHLVIITACIPTIKPLYVKSVRKILALIRGKSTTSQETDETYVAHRSKFVQPEPKLPMEV